MGTDSRETVHLVGQSGSGAGSRRAQRYVSTARSGLAGWLILEIQYIQGWWRNLNDV